MKDIASTSSVRQRDVQSAAIVLLPVLSATPTLLYTIYKH